MFLCLEIFVFDFLYFIFDFMNIIWHGQSFFEITTKSQESGELKIAIDPYGEGLGLKVPQVSAEILLISHKHSDHSNIKAISGKPFLIDENGEYEIKGIFIKTVPLFHDTQEGKERGSVICFIIEVEQMRLCYLSDLGQKELSSEQLEQIGEVDILLIPVGGNYTIGPKEAATIISQIEPRVVIPMHYKIPGLKKDLEGVDKFLKVMGQESAEPQKKLKVVLKDLPREETKIVVLSV